MDSPKVFYNYGVYLSINWKHCALFMGCSQLIHSFKLLGYIEVMPKAVISSLACSPLCVLSPVSRSAFQPFPFPLWKKAISLPCISFMKRHMHVSWLPTPGLLPLPYSLRSWVSLGANGSIALVVLSSHEQLCFLSFWWTVSLWCLSKSGLKTEECRISEKRSSKKGLLPVQPSMRNWHIICSHPCSFLLFSLFPECSTFTQLFFNIWKYIIVCT